MKCDIFTSPPTADVRVIVYATKKNSELSLLSDVGLKQMV